MTRLSADRIKNLFPKLKQNTDETSEPNIQSDKTMGRVLWITVKWNVGGSWKWWSSKQTFTVLPGAWRRRMAMARTPQLCSPVMKWARVDRELETINSRTGWLLPIWVFWVKKWNWLADRWWQSHHSWNLCFWAFIWLPWQKISKGCVFISQLIINKKMFQ